MLTKNNRSITLIVTFFTLFLFGFTGCQQEANEVKANKPNKIDFYLDKYEKTLSFFEDNITNPYSISHTNIKQLNKLMMDFNNESNNLQGTETWTSEQINRHIKLTEKLLWAIHKVTSVIEVVENNKYRY